MSGDVLTERERELLAGIRELLDIPRAAPGHFPAMVDNQQTRLYRMLGALDHVEGDKYATFPAILLTLRRMSAEPLIYPLEQAADGQLANGK